MKVTLESTTRIVEIQTIAGDHVPARVWEGVTDSGIHVVALITRIAAETAEVPARLEEFRRELDECKVPSAPAVDVFPTRFVL